MKQESLEQSPLRPYDPLLLKIIPPLAALFIKLLMLSWRVIKIEGKQNEITALAQSGRRALYATWHQRMAFQHRQLGVRNLIIMVSQSRDGEYAARLARRLGFQEMRGSSTRGGLRALRQLAQKIRDGASGGMLADGPLGPPRVAKMGSVVIARNAQAPIIPVAWGADRCWTFNSWDRFLIPKPFARIVIYYGEPIRIPLSDRGKQLEKHRLLLEKTLNYGARWCDEHFGPERPWRKTGP